MPILDGVKNSFIGATLKRTLDGNVGSNILGAILTAILAANIDYAKALRGFKFEDANDAAESAKLVAAVLLAVFSYFVGKRKPAAP